MLESSGGLAPGEVLELEFHLPPTGAPLRVGAKVVRKEPPDRTSLQFTEISPEDRSAIQQYILGELKE